MADVHKLLVDDFLAPLLLELLYYIYIGCI